MGAQISLEHSAAALAQMRVAEEALLSHYELLDQRKVFNLELPAKESLLGVTKARVWNFGPDTGNPVLFVHGGGGSPNDWVPLLPPLVSQQRRLLLVERPGHGLSDPFDYSNHIPDEFAACFLSTVLEALDIKGKVDLVGNSMGGAYSIWFAKANPAQVRSLAIVGVPPLFEGFSVPLSFHFMGSWVGKQVAATSPPRMVAYNLYARVFAQDMSKVPDVYVDYMWSTMRVRNNALSFQSLVAKILPSLFSSEPAPFCWRLEDFHDLAASIPILFVSGPEDNVCGLTPQHSDKIAHFIGTNRVVSVGKGHLPWLDDPEGVADSITELWECCEQKD